LHLPFPPISPGPFIKDVLWSHGRASPADNLRLPIFPLFSTDPPFPSSTIASDFFWCLLPLCCFTSALAWLVAPSSLARFLSLVSHLRSYSPQPAGSFPVAVRALLLEGDPPPFFRWFLPLFFFHSNHHSPSIFFPASLQFRARFCPSLLAIPLFPPFSTKIRSTSSRCPDYVCIFSPSPDPLRSSCPYQGIGYVTFGTVSPDPPLPPC